MNYSIVNLRQIAIALAYSRWSTAARELSDGYTIILPTPSDLPVFFSLALQVLNRQDRTDLKEIIVVPDWPSVAFEKVCREIAVQFPDLPIRVVDLRLRDRVAWVVTKGITTRHFTQLVRGVDEAHTTHAILHDSDLFLPPGEFLRKQYETCRDHGLAVLGVESRGDMRCPNRVSFAATWEMTFSVKWFKSFPPFMHRGQFSFVNGSRLEFDTTNLPQYLTDEKLISWSSKQGEFFHFQYVIASYRKFVNKQRLPRTYGLRLFLLRALIDAFDVFGWDYPAVPQHEEFVEGKFGLRDLLCQPDDVRRVREFARTLQGILHAGIFDERQNALLDARLSELLASLEIDQSQL